MVRIKAFAKINPVLNVLNKREDGYHFVNLLLQSISIYDVLNIEFNGSGIYNTTFTDTSVDSYKNNIQKAITLFSDAAMLDFGINVHTENNIPPSSGLGGSSVAAGAMLRYLNNTFNNILSEEELNVIAAKIGADVPFCLNGGFAFAEGIGEKLSYYSNNLKAKMLIIKETYKPSTGEMYALLDITQNRMNYDVEKVIHYAKIGDYYGYVSSLGNSFELTYPNFEVAKTDLLNFGADGVILCGSGSAICAFFSNENKLKSAYNHYQSKGVVSFICEFSNKSYEIE